LCTVLDEFAFYRGEACSNPGEEVYRGPQARAPNNVELKAADLIVGSHKAKKGRHKPTLAGALKQASRARLGVSRCEINQDGSMVLVMGKEGDWREDENEKPEDIMELLK
jgi:hypothetical protein